MPNFVRTCGVALFSETLIWIVFPCILVSCEELFIGSLRKKGSIVKFLYQLSYDMQGWWL